jgi:hypothetical protein
MIVNYTNSVTQLQPKHKPLAPQAFQGVRVKNADVISFGKRGENAEKTEKVQPKEKVQVLKNIAIGVLNPIKDIAKAIIENPIPTGAIIAAAVATIHFLPIVGTALAVGVCGFGAYKMAESTVSAIKAKKGGDIERANKECRDFGEGLFDVGLTVMPAIKGVKELRGTADAISEASKAASKTGETVHWVQKMYSIIKQVQKSDDVVKAPTTISDMIAKIKDDGIKELAALRGAYKMKESSKELQKVIEKVADPSKKKQLLELLDELAKVSDKAQKSEALNQINVILKNEKILSTDIQKVLEIAENIKDQPAVVAIIKQALKMGNGSLDDAARAVNKAVGGTRFSDNAARTIAAADDLGVKPSNQE